MKLIRSRSLSLLLLCLSALPLIAAEASTAPTWHAQSLGQAVFNMLLFAACGVVMAVVGYKVFDLCTPGNLTREIVENKNMAAAIVAGSVILGVCLITAAAMFS